MGDAIEQATASFLALPPFGIGDPLTKANLETERTVSAMFWSQSEPHESSQQNRQSAYHEGVGGRNGQQITRRSSPWRPRRVATEIHCLCRRPERWRPHRRKKTLPPPSSPLEPWVQRPRAEWGRKGGVWVLGGVGGGRISSVCRRTKRDEWVGVDNEGTTHDLLSEEAAFFSSRLPTLHPCPPHSCASAWQEVLGFVHCEPRTKW